jgi:hypothetical protein
LGGDESDAYFLPEAAFIASPRVALGLLFFIWRYIFVTFMVHADGPLRALRVAFLERDARRVFAIIYRSEIFDGWRFEYKVETMELRSDK